LQKKENPTTVINNNNLKKTWVFHFTHEFNGKVWRGNNTEHHSRCCAEKLTEKFKKIVFSSKCKRLIGQNSTVYNTISVAIAYILYRYPL
jgi:hypothetical protein